METGLLFSIATLLLAIPGVYAQERIQNDITYQSEFDNSIDTKSLQQIEGGYPSSELIQSDNGLFYGVAPKGGENGNGVLYQIDSDGVYKTLYSFHRLNPDKHNDDGVAPTGRLLIIDHNFFGAAAGGGENGTGTLFRITDSGALELIHTFSQLGIDSTNTDGASPTGGLLRASDSYLYGTTQFGGEAGTGTIFRVSIKGDFTTLYSFTRANTDNHNRDGALPLGDLVEGKDGFIYGATISGGRFGFGTVYRFNTRPSESGAPPFTTMHAFSAIDSQGINTDGAIPSGGVLLGNDESIYGTTSNGGEFGSGVIYKIERNKAFSTLYSFSAVDNNGTNPDGAGPNTRLIFGNDESLFGTTRQGGRFSNGTLFRFNLSGSLTSLYSFSPQTEWDANRGGSNPNAGLLFGSDHSLYGTATNGGRYANGTFFRISMLGNFTELHSFDAHDHANFIPDGSYPESPLTFLSDGLFYGVTPSGGLLDNGTIFSINTLGDFKDIYEFNGDDGSGPNSKLILGRDGYLYGTSSHGGLYQNGFIFRVNAFGNVTNLFSFGPLGPGDSNTEGASPNGLILSSDGNFYGTAMTGGSNGSGTIFRFDPVTRTPEVVYSFNRLNTNGLNPDGASPQANLVEGEPGILYGTARSGGDSGNGTVYRVSSAGNFSVLHSFGWSDGAQPVAPLVFGPDGLLYGTTETGGAPGGGSDGTVFKVARDGSFFMSLYSFSPFTSFTTDHSLGINRDGAYPYAGLVKGSNGFLYGATSAGGRNGTGTIFRITSTGSYSNLFTFDNHNGAAPLSSLTIGPDLMFYGTTQRGGLFGHGTIFRVPALGGYEITLHQFN